MKKAIAVIVVIIILGGGGYAITKHNNKNNNSATPAASSQSKSSPSTPTDQKAAASSSQSTGTNFTINANDETADVKTLNVKKGDTITVTFKVDTNNVYHGGLQFQSSVVNSKPIKPGDSDTVTFTANKSFDFTPYWYQSSIKKDYVIAVKVQ